MAEKVYPFSGNEAHQLISGGPKWVLGGGQKVYVEKVDVLFRSPTPTCTSLGMGKGQGVLAREGVPAHGFLELWAVWAW